ncbi:hypothetical protein ABZ897_00820 [Nonomuraea sp. NPDC046802]|uniref:hypothetical protein n=1 Tax=Nonomuraea sp. NPDC046802 TaxID=3154919 RepID=UPI0033F972DB
MPFNLGPRGERLWASLLAQDATLEDEEAPGREVALSACRTADRLETLEELAATAEPMIEGRMGPVANPLLTEVRQQAALLARLVAALRLPDQATGKRPQKRQLRGVQRPASVSSLEQARRASGG